MLLGIFETWREEPTSEMMAPMSVLNRLRSQYMVVLAINAEDVVVGLLKKSLHSGCSAQLRR